MRARRFWRAMPTGSKATGWTRRATGRCSSRAGSCIVDDRVVVVDPCVGNGRSLPDFAIFDNLDTPFIERFAATGIRPEDVDVGLLHAPAQRSLRLEHGAARRQIRADLSQCALLHGQARGRALGLRACPDHAHVPAKCRHVRKQRAADPRGGACRSHRSPPPRSRRAWRPNWPTATPWATWP